MTGVLQIPRTGVQVGYELHVNSNYRYNLEIETESEDVAALGRDRKQR